MSDQSLGKWLRRERERRGITLRSISDETKVALPLLQGLEDDDVSRWPGGIFRRAFVRAYATAVGLDPEEIVKRFEQEHGGAGPAADAENPAAASAVPSHPPDRRARAVAPEARQAATPIRSRALGTAADLAVALMLGLGFAAAGSRLLWPVLLIAVYYAAGVLLTGTSPMVALLRQEAVVPPPAEPSAPASELRVVQPDRRAPVRRPLRVVRSPNRTPRTRVQ